jgi:transcriptional regulator with XRE-family HTH domain
MKRKFSELRDRMSPEARAESEQLASELRTAIALAELRMACGMSQAAVAQVLNVNQPAVAKLERRSDMYVSTLRGYVAAMGGELRLQARFPTGMTEIALPDSSSSAPTSFTSAAIIAETLRRLEESGVLRVEPGRGKTATGLPDRGTRFISLPLPNHFSNGWATKADNPSGNLGSPAELGRPAPMPASSAIASA